MDSEIIIEKPKSCLRSTQYWEDAVNDICKGDKDAAELCLSLWGLFHLVDDAVDGDKKVDPRDAAKILLRSISVLTVNPFWQKHSVELWPLLVQSSITYCESEEWAKRTDPRDRICSQWMKSAYYQVFLHIAAIKGGFDHALEMACRYRDVDYDL